MSLHSWLIHQHRHPSPLGQLALAIPALGYRMGLGAVSSLRKTFIGAGKTLNTPVISVGNLTTGGTGKSPVVIALAKAFLARGHNVVVLTRGYRAPEYPPNRIPLGPQHGDEPWMIQQALASSSCPSATGTVLVGANRLDNARYAEANLKPDVFLLDDGFQHHAIQADYDIVLVDASLPLTDIRVLPAGPYREPLSALSRAHAVWTTKGTDAQRHACRHYLAQLSQRRGWPLTIEDAPIGPSQWWAPLSHHHPEPAGYHSPIPSALQQPCIAVSALAQNQAFYSMLTQTGITLQNTLPFPDHYSYTGTDVKRIEAMAHTQNLPILTTEKDWVKLAPLIVKQSHSSPSRWWVLQVAPQVPLASLWQWWENRPSQKPYHAGRN